MNNNNLAYIGFGLMLIGMTAATGNYLYATLADFFFMGAYLSHRKQQRSSE